MITIEFFKNGISITGHADFKKPGKDIYCAGVSAISIGALNWFKKDEIIYKFSSGDFKMKILNNNDRTNELLNLLKIQLESLNSKEYKKYISIVKQNKKEFNYE